MSLFEAKLPSLKDKIKGQVVIEKNGVKVEGEKKEKEEVKKGRRLNK